MNIQETIILGIVSGIFTSAFIFLFLTTFNKIILPWYRTIIYSGIDISGSWEEVAEHAGAKDQSKITFNQRDQKITGLKTIIKTWRETNKIDTKVLIVNGHFQDGHILLTMYNQDRKIQSLSTSLLRIAKGGSALVGN